MELVGRKVSREFQGLGLLSGTVKSYDLTTGFFEIVYEDGDSEELEYSELALCLDGEVGDQIDVPELSKDHQAGRKPKKRGRFVIDGNSGNDFVDLSSNSSLIPTVMSPDNDFPGRHGFVKTLVVEIGAREKIEEANHGLNLYEEMDLSNGDFSNHVLDLNAKLNLDEEDILKKSSAIDLNLNLNEQAVDSILKDDDLVYLGKTGRCFDLNLGLHDDMNLDAADVDGNAEVIEMKNGNLKEILKEDDLEIVEGTPLLGFSGSTESMKGDVIQKEDDNYSCRDQVTMESNENLGKKGKGRKRKKLSDTVLRRSSRRGNSSFSSHISGMELDLVDDNKLPSPSVSAVSEEKLIVSSVEAEGQNSPSEKPNLPPSSEHLNLDGIHILDFFSVYSFLRSFSTSLFLSPFDLEDFVAALRCKTSNLLFDFIHVSILQILRKHLEFLTVESSESASLCLRSLNWDLLDLITWPIYMIEYLIMHTTGSKPDFDLTQLKFFENDYYQQSENVKIEILRCLCDDVIESESIRVEINRRLMGTETNIIDYNISKKRRAANQENSDENQDWNSDECHLCKMDGNLICCDGCPAAFHSKCVGVAASSLPEGEWYCPECKFGQSIRVEKSTRGAELLGVDPYGRIFYSSCGYLLVSDSCESGSLFTYYHRDDLVAVIEALKSSYIFYGKILREITNLYNSSSVSNGAKSYTDSRNNALVMPPPIISSEIINPEENMNTKSEGSTKIFKDAIGIINPNKAYVNLYSFARVSASFFEKLAHKSSDKVSKKSAGELLSAQLKVISNMPREFNWSNIKNSSADARKDKCGWCIHCKLLDDDMEERDCLYITKDSVHGLEGSSNNELNLKKNAAKGHLVDVIYQIFCMEDRLHGLLVGPWLNPEYSKLWRENILESSDVASLKYLLLMFESNLRHRAFSAEWVKHVDTFATLGSASHIVNRVGRKKSKVSDMESNSTSKSASGLTLFWWRGGRISRHLFNWKVLPNSLVSKAARQGGGKKIPGILYPESSESAKRTKNLTWQAFVETSRSVEQLALQVRELDANIKWDEIENTKLLSKMDKESIKSFRSFKKVTVRRKSSEGKVVKYLLDFGKRRFIPDIVVKNGSLFEDSSSARKKYWVEESHVPLHLLKAFEEKRISRKSNKTDFQKIQVSGLLQKKPLKKKGFSYLFSKAERSEFYRCGHCKKDVLIREAVCCQICQGFFHKRHVKKSAGAIIAKCEYTCNKCQAGNHVKVDSKKSTSKLENNEKVNKASRKPGKKKQSEQPQNSKKRNNVVVPLRRSTRKVKFVSMPSKKGRKRGRPRKVEMVMPVKQEKSAMKCVLKKKRSLVPRAYWLNGLRLSNKPNDERPLIFKTEKKLLVVSEQLNLMLHKPRCVLCEECEFTSTLTYIGCETCGGWFHGDAFALNKEKVGNLIGFRCHNCRKRTPPVCPHTATSLKIPLDGSDDAVIKETT